MNYTLLYNHNESRAVFSTKEDLISFIKNSLPNEDERHSYVSYKEKAPEIENLSGFFITGSYKPITYSGWFICSG